MREYGGGRRRTQEEGEGRPPGRMREQGINEAGAGGGVMEKEEENGMEYDEEDEEGEGNGLLTACLSVSYCCRGRRCPSS